MNITGRNLIITKESVSVEIREVFSVDRMYPDGTTRFIARISYTFVDQSVQVTFGSGMMCMDEWRVVNQAIERFSTCMSTSKLPYMVEHISGLFEVTE